MAPGQELSPHSGINEPLPAAEGALDSIWAPVPPAGGENLETGESDAGRQALQSIFDKTPAAATQIASSSPPAVAARSATKPRRFLIVQSGGLVMALEAAHILEITRLSGPDQIDSGPLSTTVEASGRKLVFSALDSLMGLPTQPPARGTPIVIAGDRHREAALTVDRIMRIVDAAESEISGRDLVRRHQTGWLQRKTGGRAAIIDLPQILDRVLFEIHRGNG